MRCFLSFSAMISLFELEDLCKETEGVFGGRIFNEPDEKLKKGLDDRRFGPPTIEKCSPFVGHA